MPAATPGRLSDGVYLRFDDTEHRIGSSATTSDNAITITSSSSSAAAASNVYLMVQYSDGTNDQIYSRPVTEGETIDASDIPGLTSLENCKVWLEITDDKVTYAKRAEEEQDGSEETPAEELGTIFASTSASAPASSPVFAFASAAAPSSPVGTTSALGGGIYLRFEDTENIIGYSATISGNAITITSDSSSSSSSSSSSAAAASDVHLMVQYCDGANSRIYSRRITKEETIDARGFPGLVSPKHCLVWLERTVDRVTYAKPAEWVHHVSGGHGAA